MKQLLEKIPFLKKKKLGPVASRVKKAKKHIKGLKLKLFLVYTLPVFVVALAQAVIKEYSNIKMRQIATSTPNEIEEPAVESSAM